MKKIQMALRITLFLTGAIFLYMIVNLILVGKTYYYEVPAHMLESPYLLAAKQDGFYALEKNTLDVVFFGSSRIHTAVNPSVLWNEYGIASYDFSADEQSLAMTYWYLKEMFRYQRPQVVVINPVINPETRSGTSPHFSFDFLRSPDLKILGTLDTTVANEWLENIFPILRYHSRWDELTAEDFEYLYSDKNHPLMGFLGYSYPNRQDSTAFITTNQVSELDSVSKEQIDRILELCRRYNTQVLFAKAPWSSTEKEQARYNGLDQYLSDQSIPSLNGNKYINEIDLDFDFDYIDIVHMTYSGAEKYSRWLGKYLTGHYELKNHKGDARYDAWEQSYRLYEEKKAELESPPYVVEETLMTVSTITLENTSGEVAVQWFDMTDFLEPDTDYRVSCNISSPSGADAYIPPDLLYVDFYGTDYDAVEQNMDLSQNRWMDQEDTKKGLEGTCNTGSTLPEDVLMRVVYITNSEYSIENLMLQKIVYPLKDESSQ